MAGNLPVQAGLHAVRILRAKVTDVDCRRYTVDVQTEYENREYKNVQLASPLYHYLGEGLGGLPDIGARCLVTIPSDDTPPTVTDFLDLPAMISPPELEQEGGGSDMQQAGSDEQQMSWAGAKPKGLPGDFWIIGRDGNFTYWRRGGTLQEGAGSFCQRMYVRPRNVIRDFCENYNLSTVGADLLLESERQADSDSTDLGVRVRLQVCELLGDTKASVLLEAGKLGADNVLRFAVADKDIERSTGSVGTPNTDVLFAKDGTVDATFGDVTAEYGSLDVTVLGDHAESVVGRHSLTALDSSENLSGTKRITAANIQLSGQISLGTTGLPLCGNAEAFQIWCATHTHDPVTGLPVPPPPYIIVLNVTG